MIVPSLASPPADATARIGARFFRHFTWLLALLALAGFAPSYYFSAVFSSNPALSLLMHLHGAAFTLWMLLLVVQATLVPAGRLEWHRWLGWASVPLVVSMMTLAAALAHERTQSWLANPAFDPTEVLAFLAIPATTIVFFSGMYTAAILWRRHSAIHKRLLLVASLDICTPAVARLPFMMTLSSSWHYLAIDMLLLAIAWHDWRTLRRLHPATLWGGGLLIASQAGREWLSQTGAWLALASWLTA